VPTNVDTGKLGKQKTKFTADVINDSN